MPRQPKDNKLFVAGLPNSINNDALHNIFAPFGRLRSCKVIFNRDTGQSKGFGFVEYELDEKSACSDAIREKNGVEVDGRRLVVKGADEPNNPRGRPFDARGPVDDRSFRSFDRGFEDRRFSDGRRGSDRAPHPPGPADENKVFVAGFDYEWGEKDLAKSFEPFGKVIDVKVRATGTRW